MKIKTKSTIKAKSRELISNTANILGFLQPLPPFPIPENYPPTFVITWDKTKSRPQIIRGNEYYQNLLKSRKSNK